MLRPQRIARAGSADRAARDDDQLVAESLDHIELVGREQHRGAAGRALLEHACDDVDGERVESRERLVEDQHLRLVDERGSDLCALLVAQREGLHVVVEAFAEPQLLEQPTSAVGGIRLRVSVEPGEVDDLLEHLHLRVETPLLGHVPEAAALRRRDLGAVEGHAAAVIGEHAQHDAHRRGLAGSVAAYEAGEPAGSNVERHIVEHAPPAVALRDPSQLQHPVSFVRASNVRMPIAVGIPRATGLAQASSSARGRRRPVGGTASRPRKRSRLRGAVEAKSAAGHASP